MVVGAAHDEEARLAHESAGVQGEADDDVGAWEVDGAVDGDDGARGRRGERRRWSEWALALAMTVEGGAERGEEWEARRGRKRRGGI